MSVETFTLFHVVLSLIGIVSGLIVLVGMLSSRPLGGLNLLFLVTTIATSVTGFFFHSPFDAAEVVGVISLVVLAIALVALYGQHLLGLWLPVYVVTAVFALYLNCFVAVAQSFQKIAPLKALAPTGSEPPFVVAQAVLLVVFIVLGFIAVRRFDPPA
jgi:hypothetical protein